VTIRGLPEPPVNRIAAESVGDGPAIGVAGGDNGALEILGASG